MSSFAGPTCWSASPAAPRRRALAATRLRNGLPVALDFHLALWSGSKSNLRRRAFERFVVSYDLWEERYAVTGLRKPRITASRLKPEEIGPWCLKNIKLTELDLSRDKQIWVV